MENEMDLKKEVELMESFYDELGKASVSIGGLPTNILKHFDKDLEELNIMPIMIVDENKKISESSIEHLNEAYRNLIDMNGKTLEEKARIVSKLQYEDPDMVEKNVQYLLTQENFEKIINNIEQKFIDLHIDDYLKRCERKNVDPVLPNLNKRQSEINQKDANNEELSVMFDDKEEELIEENTYAK